MSGARVSIPNNVRKTIQNIKEITGNHSEDEIYAMLKECSMDPNETTQKLLLQDPFHEVKRKRYRKKENLNKEITEPKWKPGMQGRGNRGGRGNYPSRHISNDAGGGRTSLPAKENGINQAVENNLSQSKLQGQKNKEIIVVASSSSSKLSGPLPQIPAEANKGPTVALGSGTARGPYATSASKSPSPSPGVGLSDSDPILMPSTDSRLPVGTIRREVGSQRIPVDQIHETPIEVKSNSSGKATVEVQGMGKNLLPDSSRTTPSSHVSFSISRPSSNYNNRPQQAIGPQKVGPSMEWKPKPTNPILTQESESTKVPVIPVESQSQSQSQTPTLSASTNLDSNVTTRELEKKLEDSHISDNQHVIIPNHVHVPEAEKLGFCFGSFDASFGLNVSFTNGPVSDKSSMASEVVDESIEEQPRNQNVLATADEGDNIDYPTSSNNVPENLSVENDDSSNAGPDYRESKQETSIPNAGHPQYPIVHTSPNFSFGFMPPMIGTHLTSFENDSQGRDVSHVPSFVVQQPIDPASYYAQFYRPDGDGRVSPFHSSGPQTKFNGNVPMLSPQSSQEVGNSIMLPGTNPTPITTTQTGGIMQTSIAVTQQPLPIFRQPTGVHLPHYPPNYIPYGPYFSPYYVPSPTIHQFLSNGGTFSQPPQGGNMYPGPPIASPKYPVPQYKPGGNSGHIGMQGNYGPYGSNPTAANSTSNEDHGGSQFKESNVYMTGQQSEGSGVWVGPPGRDISGLQANSFYNLAQAGHGPFGNIYHHPAQPVTTGAVHPLLQQSQTLAGPGANMAGPTPQINWPNNY